MSLLVMLLERYIPERGQLDRRVAFSIEHLLEEIHRLSHIKRVAHGA
jgi:hypothetical protein